MEFHQYRAIIHRLSTEITMATLTDKEKEFELRLLQSLLDQYRGYLDLALKINTFSYAVTGALLSF